MPTFTDIEKTVEGWSYDQLYAFFEKNKLTAVKPHVTGDKNRKRAFLRWQREKTDKDPNYRNRLYRAFDFPPPDEAALIAKEAAAKAAERSAAASEDAAESAHSSRKAAWASVVVSVLAIVLTLSGTTLQDIVDWFVSFTDG